MRPCPACGRKIQDAAQHCHFCNAPVPHKPRADRPSPSPVRPPAEQARKSSFGTFLLIAVLVAAVVGVLVAMLR